MNKQLMTELYEGAKVVERNLGIPALFQVAQAIQESGWDFKYTPPNSFNIFGIKWHYGEYVESWTQEWNSKKGGYDDVLAKFQKYKSYAECFQDHASLLTKDIGNPSYADALIKFKKDKDLIIYVKSVSKIYATSPTYAISILDLMESLQKIFNLDWVAEKDEAKKWAVDSGLLKLTNDDDYWLKFTNREELAVILKRFKENT